MVATLRLSEHYVSTQGEGPRTGVLTQFVRFAGCNMRCPGWPCDTPYAIYPDQYRTDAKMVWPSMLAANIVDVAAETGAVNVCLTGGEPFMQPEELLKDLVHGIREEVSSIEVFTNGSFLFPPWTHNNDLHFMMDWKLQGSGEADTRLSQREHNAMHLKEGDGIKFVVKDHDDLLEAVRVTTDLERKGYEGEYWVGRVWDSTEMQDSILVDFISGMRMPWKLNVQVHKYIWPSATRGV